MSCVFLSVDAKLGVSVGLRSVFAILRPRLAIKGARGGDPSAHHRLGTQKAVHGAGCPVFNGFGTATGSCEAG